MRIAFQTILWQRRRWSRNELDAAFQQLHAAGYRGVEFADSPENLPGPGELMELLDRHDLDLVGIAGGGRNSKRQFLDATRPYWQPRQPGKLAPYVYVESCSDAEIELLNAGYRVALHLHYPMRLEEVVAMLREETRLEWLPDTAHLYISNLADSGDVLKAVRAFPEQLAAVHLKDWTEKYGRTSYRYAKGFIELGQGDLGEKGILDEVAEYLKASSRSTTVVAELDYARFSEIHSLWQCAGWMAAKGIHTIPTPEPSQGPGPMVDHSFAPDLTRLAEFADPDFYEHAAGQIRDFSGADAVGIWAYDLRDKTLSELASTPLAQPFGKGAFEAVRGFSKLALEHDGAINFDLSASNPGESAGVDASGVNYREMVEVHGIRRLIALPSFNIYNAHQVRYFIYLLYCGSGTVLTDTRLRDISDRFGRAAEIWLTEMCVLAAREASEAALQNRSLTGLLQKLVRLVQSRMRCEGVTVFLAEPPGHRLRVGATTGLDWNPKLKVFEQNYSKGDGSLTASLLDRPMTRLLRNPDRARGNEKWRSIESDLDTPGPTTCLMMPFFNRDRNLMGVVRCRNKYKQKGDIRPFNEDDVVILESLFQTSSPDIEILASDYNRQRALSRLFHELEQPLGSSQSAIVMADYELKRLPPNLLREAYLEDALSWIELSNRLLKSFDFLNWEFRQPNVLAEWVLPVRDIIAPAVRQVRAMLSEKAFSDKRIDYGDENVIRKYPEMYIDRNMFQQVFFNLLTNAIKYAKPNARDFRVEIRPDSTPEFTILYFRDWGRGIPKEWSDAVFEEGVRVGATDGRFVPGRGLGLWVVRRIIQMHNGSIELTNNAEPTQFEIHLPRQNPMRDGQPRHRGGAS